MITASYLRSLTTVLQPTIDELQAMVTDLCERKNWTHGIVAALCGITDAQIHEAMTHGKDLPECVYRSIWMLYTLDHKPACLQDVVWMASWANGKMAAPVKKESDPVEVEKLRTALKEHNALNINGAGGHWSIRTLLSMFPKLSDSRVRQTAKELGYKLGKVKAIKRMKASSPWNPTSKWITLDWRRTDGVLSHLSGMKVQTVAKVRAEYRLHPRMAKRLFRSAGANMEMVAVLLKDCQNLSHYERKKPCQIK